MKKLLIILSITAGLSLILAIASRLSASFSEWYALNIYPALTATLGQFWGLFPFSVAEFYLISVILAAVAGLVFAVVKLIRGKGKRKRIAAFSGVIAGCVVSTMALQFLLTCGINYNRRTFLHSEYSSGAISFERTLQDEFRVFSHLLAEFEEVFPDLENQLTFDENGIFVQTSDVTVTAPAAMAKFAESQPKLSSHFPRPKPVSLFAELMSDAFIIGIYFPFTMEANFNSIAPDSERGVTALHELVHLTGFMREDEANFIAFAAGRESGDSELMYSAYLMAFDMLIAGVKHKEMARAMYNMLPEQIHRDWAAQRAFWRGRLRTVEHIIGDDGEVVDTIVVEDPVAGAIQDASSSLNNLWLWSQGQDGTVSYSRMVDLLFATELAKLNENQSEE